MKGNTFSPIVHVVKIKSNWHPSEYGVIVSNMVFLTTLKQWSEVSTIHGVRYACEEDKSNVQRLLWFIIVCVSTILAIYMSLNICSDWREQVRCGNVAK